MRVINKKMVVVVLLIIEFTCGYLMYQSSKKEVDLAKVTYEEEINNNMFAMYVENEDTGEYDEITNTNTFPEGYILNMDKTGCIDNKGNSISDILTSKDDKVMVKSNKTVFCYLYFDKDNRVYTQVKRDYKNSSGALLLSETESDEYPVYYYNGNITNNNILYANHCWKMVRTTETGGVKLIYNGVPDETEDGTLTCDNTGEESQIGTSAFNPNHRSLAYAGYMYNDVYNVISRGFSSSKYFIGHYIYPGEYYYGDTATWNEETGQYELSNKDGSEVTTYTWADNYTNLIGKYTCLSSSNISCANAIYVVGTTATRIYWNKLSEGKDYDDYTITLATSVIDNGDGTHTLVNSIEVIQADWYTTYNNYINYYYCGDLTSVTCSDMYYSTGNSVDGIGGYSLDKIKYGNSIEYENGVYKLVDTKEFWNWSENYNQLNNNHYTCFNTIGECEQIHYIHFTNKNNAFYITISDGKSVEDAINEMLYAKDVNTTDSTIKNYIDIWYEDNIIGLLDSNSKLYSSYLENTIFCNNRAITNLSESGWNPNGGSTNTYYMSFNTNSLKCENKTDQFTLKVESGGTEGYGNNTLDYPIGLLTFKEANLANSTGYLKSGSNYWLLSPETAYYDMLKFAYISSSASWGSTYASNSIAVRPSVSLSNKVEILEGNGSVATPYQIILPS